MDIKKLDQDLQAIALKRNELATLDYHNPKYDDLEEQLHDLEDAFQVTFGDYLEGVLQKVHDSLCPDSDVLYPVAYLAKTHEVKGGSFEPAPAEGVFVEVDKYPGQDTKLVLAPAPLRIMLSIGKSKREVVWQAEGK